MPARDTAFQDIFGRPTNHLPHGRVPERRASPQPGIPMTSGHPTQFNGDRRFSSISAQRGGAGGVGGVGGGVGGGGGGGYTYHVPQRMSYYGAAPPPAYPSNPYIQTSPNPFMLQPEDLAYSQAHQQQQQLLSPQNYYQWTGAQPLANSSFQPLPSGPQYAASTTALDRAPSQSSYPHSGSPASGVSPVPSYRSSGRPSISTTPSPVGDTNGLSSLPASPTVSQTPRLPSFGFASGEDEDFASRFNDFGGGISPTRETFDGKHASPDLDAYDRQPQSPVRDRADAASTGLDHFPSGQHFPGGAGPSPTESYQHPGSPAGFYESRRESADSDSNSFYHDGGRPLLAHASQQSFASTSAHSHAYPSTSGNFMARKSAESVRVMPTQPKASNAYSDRSFSFSGNSERPDLQMSMARPSSYGPSSSRPSTSSAIVTASRRTPIVYPALLSRVAEAFKARIALSERGKDGLAYPDAFDGREAVDRIAYIIKTTDRNLALLLGRALDAQKFFHDVTYDHRLRDSPNELYQFRERMPNPFDSDEMSPTAADGDQSQALLPQIQENGVRTRRPSISNTVLSDESSMPSGVFTLLTDCYSPTCTRDRLCYSIACPRRLEQQARLNLMPKPGLKRSVSSESLGDIPEPGTLWIHTVSPDIAAGLTDTEKKRQEAINEVIYTERDFVRDLEYLRESWIKPLRSSNVIPEDHREEFVTQVFWNVLEIHSVNIRLTELLNKRQKSQAVVERIGDIFLDQVPRFAPFVKYGAHQLYGKYEFEKEKAANPAFAKFVDEVERKPESRKLELNGYLTKPTTRLARYPLLLEVVLKYTSEDSPDKKDLPQVVKLVREFLSKVNEESGRSENRFNLAQLDQQLRFKTTELVDLRLRDEKRELLFKGAVKKRGGTGSDSAELQMFLFDHALLMVKQRSSNKNDHYKVYRKPIPLELLVVTPPDDGAPNSRTSTVRPKSLMSRNSTSRYLTMTNGMPLASQLNSKNGFPMTFTHLGRRGYNITVWSPSWAGRKKWLDKIEERQIDLRKQSMVFDYTVASEGFFTGTNRVTCMAPFDMGRRMFYGTENGVYMEDLRQKEKSPIKVISVTAVTQIDVLDDQGILIVLADKAVQTFYVDALDPADAVGVARRARKISNHATFFKVGQCLNRTLVCVVKAGSTNSTIKVLECTHDNKAGKKQPALRKLLQGGGDSLKVLKEFYVNHESTSLHFLKSKLCLGCPKGFEIIDLQTLEIQGLLDPDDSSLDFVQKRETVRPYAIFRVDTEFLLCYDDCAFLVSKRGWRSRPNFLIQWEGAPTAFALRYPYVLAFEPTFIEVRRVDTGALMQIIPGSNLQCFYTESPQPIHPPTTSTLTHQHGPYFSQMQYPGSPYSSGQFTPPLQPHQMTYSASQGRPNADHPSQEPVYLSGDDRILVLKLSDPNAMN